MAEIRFDNVLKRYKDNLVIPGISLNIRDGEFFTFVGPSGCGKSTMLNMIAGLEAVSDGKLWFDDLLVNDLSPRERDIAMVFQSYALYPHMTVFENIAFPLRMQKIAKSTIEEEVRRVAALLGLQELLKRRPKELSGGQRQRVALGRAIIRRPKVFLMDEPLSNLDARLRIDMREELKSLHQQLGITTIYVTHEQAEAMSLSDRIAVMNNGVIQQCAPPSEIYLRPANVFVAGFMGSMPINLMPGKVVGTDPVTVDCSGVLLSPAVGGVPKGETVTVGLRPEDLNVVPRRTAGSTPIRISLIEPAGSFFWIDFQWNGLKGKARSEVRDDLAPKSEAYMEIPPEKVLVFDSATGERL